MPQIPGDKIAEFLAWLESKGVQIRLGQKAVGGLKATQKDINSAKVEALRGSGVGGPPILISADDYILDGHHRWAALLVEDPLLLIRVIKVNLPIKLLLEVGLEFPGSFSRDINDKKVASLGFDLLARTVSWRYILECP